MNSAGNQDSSRANRWSDQFLDQMRQTGDPLGDSTITAIFQENGIQTLDSLWQGLIRHNLIPPQGLPPQIYPYLEKSAQLPAWADPKLIAQGEQFFLDHGFLCLISLLFASLPECYILSNEAEVLGTTQSLDAHALRRVFETTQLIVAVMRKEGLTHRGTGVQAAQKVRLMHAAIRYMILNTPRREGAPAKAESFPEQVKQIKPWDAGKFGHPINQEDMAYTLLTFSYVILRSFRIMKIEVTPDETRAYLHSWNVVGYVMGVREDLLAHTMEDAEELFSRIKKRQFGESDAGTALANALVKAATEKIIPRETGGWLSGAAVRRFPPVIMRQLLDRETIKALKIERLTFLEWLMLMGLRLLVRVFAGWYQEFVAFAGRRLEMHIINYLTKIPQGWQRELFRIPDKIGDK